MSLLNATLELVKNTSIPPSESCKAVGVTTRWLKMVQAGDIKNPGVLHIQKLHDYLKEREEIGASA